MSWAIPGASPSEDLGPLNPLLLGQISSAPGELLWADTLLDSLDFVTTVRRVICTGWTVGGGAAKVIGTATGVGAPISQAAYWTGVGACSAASSVNDIIDVGASAYGLWQQYENISDLRTDVQLLDDFADGVWASVLRLADAGASYTSNVSVGALAVADVSVGRLDDFGAATGTISVTNSGTADAAVRGALYVYRHRGSTFDELIVPPVPNSEGDLILHPGESATLDFDFFVPAGSRLRADKYYAQAYVLSSGGLDVSGDFFRACGPSACFVDDLWDLAAAGSIPAGGRQAFDLGVAAAAVQGEFVLGYRGSDLDLHLYDAQGRHVGMNYETGSVDLEIPGAEYSGGRFLPRTRRRT